MWRCFLPKWEERIQYMKTLSKERWGHRKAGKALIRKLGGAKTVMSTSVLHWFGHDLSLTSKKNSIYSVPSGNPFHLKDLLSDILLQWFLFIYHGLQYVRLDWIRNRTPNHFYLLPYWANCKRALPKYCCSSEHP